MTSGTNDTFGSSIVSAVEGNLLDLDSGDTISELPANRLSLTGSANANRRQSMNLIFTTDHKLRLSNNDTIASAFTESAPVDSST